MKDMLNNLNWRISSGIDDTNSSNKVYGYYSQEKCFYEIGTLSQVKAGLATFLIRLCTPIALDVKSGHLCTNLL